MWSLLHIRVHLNYFVMNNGLNDISKFLDHFTRDYIKGNGTKEEMKLDRETDNPLKEHGYRM